MSLYPSSKRSESPPWQRNRDDLSGMTDEALVTAYEQTRDAAVTREGTRSYPNIRLLRGTPFEREKDRREVRAGLEEPSEVQRWYEKAQTQPCTWWLRHHLVAKHALRSCMSCGACTALCPAAQYHEEYNPRAIVDMALSGDELRIEELLRSETLWYCGQCGSCKPKCPRGNNIVGLIGSLRQLAQLKGLHLSSTRGKQQYAARHLWGGNFWNRGCSMYFRDLDAAGHLDFGPRFARYAEEVDTQMERIGANPDREGCFGGRKVDVQTLDQLRRCIRLGGTLCLWDQLEICASRDARAMGLDLDAYHARVRSEG